MKSPSRDQVIDILKNFRVKGTIAGVKVDEKKALATRQQIFADLAKGGKK